MDSKELSSISDCFGDQITNKNTKTYTKWLEMIAKVLSILIGLKGDNYYSKVDNPTLGSLACKGINKIYT